MFDEQTYEVILQRMLDHVLDSVDKREGSIIYDALTPAAAEIAQLYIELNSVLELGFAMTTNGSYLDLRTQELGVYRQQATKTVREATFNIAPGLGARFFIDDLYFTVIENGTTAQVECETVGTIGDEPSSGGELLPIETIKGLTTAILGDVLIPGTETETDDELLKRYLIEVSERATSGNVYHYDKWAREVDGVGDVKVFPLWDEVGTVKLLIVDANKNKASDELVKQVQDYIDPNKNGDGSGEAPIGAQVTVESAATKSISVSATLTLEDGKSVTDVQDSVESSIDEYLKSIVFTERYVRLSKIGELILNVDGVIDYENLKLNSGTGNIPIENDIPVCEGVTLSG